MTQPTSSPHRVRVGMFQIDLDSGEVSNNGTRARLQMQSLELLKALLESPGAMVSREELRRRLWPDDTFVDFDHGLNAAVRRLRETLGDSAESPRFVETIPRKGYRLIAETAVTQPAVLSDSPAPAELEPRIAPRDGSRVASPAYLKAALGMAAVVAAGVWLANAIVRPANPPPVATFTIDVPAGWNLQSLDQVALSPDGRFIAFSAMGPDHRASVWLRALTEPTARQIPGTELGLTPFWSPDGAQIGFFANGTLKAVTLGDGRVRSVAGVAPARLPSGFGTWTHSGDILFMPVGPALGTPVHAATLRRLDMATETTLPFGSPIEHRDYVDHVAPTAIPGSDAFTFLRWNPMTLEMTAHVAEVGTARVTDLGRTESRVVVTPSGHAVFVRNGALVAQPFDVAARKLAGAPFPLAQDVAVLQPMLGHFSASSDLIVYLSRGAMTGGAPLMLMDRKGTPMRAIGETAEYSAMQVSPDGTRVAVGRRDPVSGTRDIWVHDLAGQAPVRLTFDPRDDMSPAWSADGRTILFTSDRSGERDIYRKDVAGGMPDVLVFASADSKSLNASSPDGQFFVYDTGARASIDAQGHLNKDLMMVSLGSKPRIRSVAATAASESAADISRDGTLVAYQSSETGRSEIFVETFPEKGGRWQVTTTGGIEPIWRADGRELFFLSARDELSVVDVDRRGEGLHFGPPRVLFTLQNPPSTVRRYAPLPDGQSFITSTGLPHRAAQRMTVLVNWRSALPR